MAVARKNEDREREKSTEESSNYTEAQERRGGGESGGAGAGKLTAPPLDLRPESEPRRGLKLPHQVRSFAKVLVSCGKYGSGACCSRSERELMDLDGAVARIVRCGGDVH